MEENLSTSCAAWSWGKESQEPFYMLRGGAYLLYFNDFAEALDLAITLYLVATHHQDADPKIKERLEDLRRFVDFDLNPPPIEEEENKVSSEEFAKMSSEQQSECLNKLFGSKEGRRLSIFGTDHYEHALGWAIAQSVSEPHDEEDKS